MKITKDILKNLIKEEFESLQEKSQPYVYKFPPIPAGMAYPDQDGIYPMLGDDGFPVYQSYPENVYEMPKYKEFFDWLESHRPQGPPQLEPEPEEKFFDPDREPEPTYAVPLDEDEPLVVVPSPEDPVNEGDNEALSSVPIVKKSVQKFTKYLTGLKKKADMAAAAGTALDTVTGRKIKMIINKFRDDGHLDQNHWRQARRLLYKDKTGKAAVEFLFHTARIFHDIDMHKKLELDVAEPMDELLSLVNERNLNVKHSNKEIINHINQILKGLKKKVDMAAAAGTALDTVTGRKIKMTINKLRDSGQLDQEDWTKARRLLYKDKTGKAAVEFLFDTADLFYDADMQKKLDQFTPLQDKYGSRQKWSVRREPDGRLTVGPDKSEPGPMDELLSLVNERNLKVGGQKTNMNYFKYMGREGKQDAMSGKPPLPFMAIMDDEGYEAYMKGYRSAGPNTYSGEFDDANIMSRHPEDDGRDPRPAQSRVTDMQEDDSMEETLRALTQAPTTSKARPFNVNPEVTGETRRGIMLPDGRFIEMKPDYRQSKRGYRDRVAAAMAGAAVKDVVNEDVYDSILGYVNKN